MGKTLYRGAEATIILQNNKISKKRDIKNYRIEKINNKLIKSRTKKEIKIIKQLEKIIPVPKILEESKNENEILMSYIPGEKLSEKLDNLKSKLIIAKKIGENLSKMHNLGIIHGDLTTSNMIIDKKNLYFIDFGLSFYSNKTEDKATDLHLIKEALEAKHFKYHKKLFEKILEGYKKAESYKKILERLNKVEIRGRYKQQH